MGAASGLVLALAIVFGGSATLVYSMAVRAQRIATSGGGITGLSTEQGAAKTPHVHLITDALSLSSAEPAYTELRFRIDDGFHINSHKPVTEFMIPTTLTFSPAEGLRVLDEQYPRGESFRLGSTASGELLSVYQREFRVGLRVSAARGTHTLEGTLHYQACDQAACFPPRSLPFTVAVRGE